MSDFDDSGSDFHADEGSDSDFEVASKKPKNAPKPKASPKKPPKEKQPAAAKPKKAAASPKKSKENLNGSSAANGVAENGENPMKIFESIDETSKKGKRLSIEKIYQKKSQLEHILLRPDTYIGSVEKHQTQMWVYESPKEEGQEGQMTLREITYVPGLYKIFDEILVNAADNKQRDKSMNTIKIVIDQEKNEISVWNNGKGIPVVEHSVEKMYVPEMIFGTLLTSSNYNDEEQKVTGGRNGYGAKLCNIFSKSFTVETSSKEYESSFKQTWTENMGKAGKAKISAAKGDDFTKVTFQADLGKFGMDALDDDIVSLMKRRAYDVAGTTRGVKVFLNGKKLPVNGFKQYVELYLKNRTDEGGEPLKMAYEQVNDRWEVAVCVSDRGFQNVSFCNSIATTKGGRHVDYVADALTAKLVEHVKKSLKKGNMSVKPFQIKQHMWIFVNSLIVNPTFDSQTKENMTLQAKSFGSKCDPTDKFVGQAIKCGISDAVLNWVKFKQMEQMDKKCSAKKTSKLKGVPKLEDANDAGTKNSKNCTLILTEGDSAKTLAVSGLGVVGRDSYGVFPLKGKCLNVREATHKQIMENAEINNIIKILGLQYKKKYSTEEELKTLRYGKLMVMADQDQDGSHIKGLIVNFIHFNWPSLIQSDFVEEFITPIVKAIKNKDEVSFFSIPEYMAWKNGTPNWHTYRIKYYKGLGTSTAKEAKEYFSDMRRHRIPFKYGGREDDDAIELAFSKKKIEERKDWLTSWMKERRNRRENNMDEDYLYNQATRSVSFKDFINKELILFSNMDNERSIPSMVDGLKPGQRKVMYTCFRRNDKREVKVAQLAGSVAEMSEYHHGEASLMSTIVNLAQNYVGSNNINLLQPIGQFGTRLQGGKDSASPRYIFTKLNPVTRTLFPQADDDVLRYLFEDNRKIEPEWYCPIIPMILVNGASGIGTGWSTSIPNYDPRILAKNILKMLNDEEPEPMSPWYKGFTGEIEKLDNSRFVASGEAGLIGEGNTVEITELPVKTWTQSYKESVLDPMLGTEKVQATISDFKEYHTDTTVKFKVKMTGPSFDVARAKGVHTYFKLQTIINLTSMVMFDAEGVLRKYNDVADILKDFFKVRKLKYIDRKNFLEGMLKAQALRLTNQARFILEKISGDIKMENKKKKVIVEQLVSRKFDPDPVKKWKDEIKKAELAAGGDVDQDEEEEDGDNEEERDAGADNEVQSRLSDFDYLVTMSLIKLSEEEKDKLLRERDTKQAELRALQAKDWKHLWRDDINVFMKALDENEEREKREWEEASKKADKMAAKAGGGGKGGRVKQLKKPKAETQPSPFAERVRPVIDASLKSKYEKVDAAKENKGKPKPSKVLKTDAAKVEDPDLDDSSLYDRMMKKSPDQAKVLKREAEKKANGGGISQFAKRMEELDDDDEDGNKDDVSVTSSKTSSSQATKAPTAAVKRKAPAANSKPSKPPAGKKSKKIDSSDDDEDSDAGPSKKSGKIVSSDEEEESDAGEEDDSPVVVKRAAVPRRGAAQAALKKYKFDDEDSEEDADGDESEEDYEMSD